MQRTRLVILRALLGVGFLCAVCWVFSVHRRRFPWRVAVFSLALQGILAALILETAVGYRFFRIAGDAVVHLVDLGEPGARLVFGVLADSAALERVFGPESATIFAFAAKGLMALIFFAALMEILYHLGVMQVVIWVLARIMSATMGTSGAESMTVAAEIFVGPTEAPLAVRPYIREMTLSELNAMMTGGFATIAGTVLAIYMGLVGQELAPHLLTASVLSAPSAFLMAKILLPETEQPRTRGRIPLSIERRAHNLFEAAANGTQDGIKLALNVAGMQIAFMALVNLINWPLGWIGERLALEGELSLGRILGWLCAPLAWIIGIDGWRDCQTVGSLLGTKTAINEFVAYLDLQALLARGAFEHERSAAIATYALCGFANFGTIGIQIGGLSTLAPERKTDIARLALRAMVGGAFATWSTAAIAGIFL